LGFIAVLMSFVAVPADAQGNDAQSKPLNYVALGDSITAGYGVETGYVTRYGAYIEADTGRPVAVVNLGTNGWTSAQLLRALRERSGFRRAVRNAHVVTWNIGTNDLRKARLKYKFGTCGGTNNQRCLQVATRRFKANWTAIAREITYLRSGCETILRAMTFYYPYVKADAVQDSWQEDGGLKDLEVLAPYYWAVNRHIGAAATEESIPYAEVHAAFNGASGVEDPRAAGYLLADWVHPNETGHEGLAGLLSELGYARQLGCPEP